jgi:drug/metabolite transporter (DMT)-like permease
MLLGYLFALLAMLSIGALGILSKLADRKGCPPLSTTFVLFGGAAALIAIYIGVFQRTALLPPTIVIATAVPFGAMALLAFWVFLYGLQFGKITTSWIFMNLSAVLPAALSAVIYHERIGIGKALVLSLVVVSILLLWKDKQEDSSTNANENTKAAQTNVRIWIVAMLGAFALNGICPFGLRILASKALAQQFASIYLFYWYIAGFAFASVWLLRRRPRIGRTNVWIGLVMAVASVGGQLFMGLAMARGTPGSVVYMLAMGTSIVVVVFGGALFFRERVGNYARAGIAVGLIAVVLLGASG